MMMILKNILQRKMAALSQKPRLSLNQKLRPSQNLRLNLLLLRKDERKRQIHQKKTNHPKMMKVTSMMNLLHPQNLKKPQHLPEKEGEDLLVVVQRPVQQSQKQLPNHLQTIKKIAILMKNISKLVKVKRAIMDLQKMAVDLIMSLVKMSTSPNLKKARRVVVAVVFEDRLKKDIDVVLTVFRMTMTVHLLVKNGAKNAKVVEKLDDVRRNSQILTRHLFLRMIPELPKKTQKWWKS